MKYSNIIIIVICFFFSDNLFCSDVTPPQISGIGYSGPACNLSMRTVTATLTDASGVSTGSLAPRCYYKVNSSSYSSIQGTLTSGSVNNGVWNFALVYSANSNDVISYFITAQDTVATPNVGASPSSGFTASDVNNVITPPASTYTYNVLGVLNGTYTVGSSGTFTNLTSAADAYNNWCIAGPVTFVLTNTTYTAGETFPITFSNTPYASATNSLLVIPGAGVSSTISSSAADNGTIKLQDARFITFDGLKTMGSSLQLVTNNTYSSAAMWLASTPSTGPGCKKIVLRNLDIKGIGPDSYGIIGCEDGFTASFSSGIGNDSIVIQNNTILKTGNAISGYVYSTSHWFVDGNIIGPSSLNSNSLTGSGIDWEGGSLTATNNLIQGIRASNPSVGGIYMWQGNNCSVIQNTITNLSTDNNIYGGISSLAGIYIGPGSTSTISKNIISEIYYYWPSGGGGARGISIGLHSNLKVENNMISKVYSNSPGTTSDFWPIGIASEYTNTNLILDNNSVYLSGNYIGAPGVTGAAALYLSSNPTTTYKIRNNIFSNTFNNSGSSSDISYSIYSATTTPFSVLDFNDYYVGGGAILMLGRKYLTNLPTLSSIQTNLGGNLNSQNVQPIFTSTNDLHLVATANASLENAGTPITGLTTDIDGQTRSTTTPDIGADEFTAIYCTTANAGTLTSTSFSICTNPTVSLNSVGTSTGATTGFQWQVSSTSGGPYSNVTGGVGSNTVTYVTGTLSPGVYYYVLQTSCLAASLTAISNEATVTINPIPSLTLSASTSTVCKGTSTNLFAAGANTYTWNTSATSFSINVLPTVTTTYSVTGTNTTGCSSTKTIGITVNPNCSDVWPGDANSDGIANSVDIFELGVNYSHTGPARATVSNSWIAYYVNNWTGLTTTSKNMAHSDCNGDGIINLQDTLAVYNNYGMTHSMKPFSTTSFTTDFALYPDQTSLPVGTWGTSSIYLGDTLTPMNNIYGAAFDVVYDTSLIQTDSIYIEYLNSYLSSGGSNILFRKRVFSNSILYTASVRTTFANVSGFGKVAKLHYKIKPNATVGSTLNLFLQNGKKTTANGLISPLTTGNGTVNITALSTNIQTFETVFTSIYPNPNSGTFIVKGDFQKGDRIELWNSLGQKVYVQDLLKEINHINSIYLTEGIYQYIISRESQVLDKGKIIIQRWKQ